MNSNLTLVSWNTKGLNHPVKRKKVFSRLQQLRAGVVFLQETHLHDLDHWRLGKCWTGQYFHSNFKAKARGTAILVGRNIPFVVSNIISDKNGRFIIVSGKLCDKLVTLANVYAPNFDDVQFFRNFFSQLPDLNSHSLILGGDFNCFLDAQLDRSSSKPASPNKSATYIKSFLGDFSLTDPWRFLYPMGRDYSFFSHVHHTYTRIDYFFVDNLLLPNLRSCSYESITISDHAPLVLSMAFLDCDLVRRHWRLDPLLLTDDKFVTDISSKIKTFLSENKTPGMSCKTIWEAMKAFLRGEIISYAAFKRKSAKQKLNDISDQILSLDRQYAQSPSPTLYKERLRLQTEFNLLSSRQVEGCLMRSKSDFYEHGEKTGKILANQLRGVRAKQLIAGVRTDSGDTTSDQKVINDKFKLFYSNLYTSDSTACLSDMETFFNSVDIPSLSSDMREGLEAPITQEEIRAAISAMQPGKSPGPDGFSVDFFKKFCYDLTPFLCQVFTDSLESGALPPSCYQACISLLLKKDKDPLDCASYRPISLLNTDVKILAKLLACRLENALPSVVSPDQTGFVKNRHSFFNIRRLFNIVYTPNHGIAECLLSMDAEKAFDRVEWEYLFFTLEKFGFGPLFCSWVKLLYVSPLASVLTNGRHSDYFKLYRGTRQGCPLSPLLFALAIEPLAIAIRGSGEIQGIFRGGLEHKVSLYADDLVLYISDPLRSLSAVLKVLDNFSKFSGYKLNLNKSEMFLINKNAERHNYESFPFKVVTDKFTYLGVCVTKQFQNLFKSNFLPLFDRSKQLLSKWCPLFLSLIGRINSVKMMLLPRFLYLFQCLPILIPKSFFKSLDSLILSFIWNGKHPRLRKVFLQRPKQVGGMALPNFQYYYWAANIRCLLYWRHFHLESTPPVWVTIEAHAGGTTSLPALLGAPLPLASSIPSSSPVVKQSLKIWSQFRKTLGLQAFSLLSPIAANHLFAPSVADAAFNVWHKKGVKCFADLYIDGQFSSFSQLATKFGIVSTQFFRFLQVRHYVQSMTPRFPHEPPDNPIDVFLSVNPTSRGVLSKLYNLISRLHCPSLAAIKTAWEQDLHSTISDDMWDTILDQVHSSSMCARHALLQFKVVHRVHLSKVKLARIYPNVDPICEKCRSAPASLLHMYWSCPSLANFWKSVFQTISEVLLCQVELNPFSAIFGVALDLDLPRFKLRMLAFSLLLARRAVLLKWKDPVSPSHAHWIRDIMLCMDLEKIRYTVRGSENQFYTVWRPFLAFFEKLSTVVTE